MPKSFSLMALLCVAVCAAAAGVDSISYLDIQDRALRRYHQLTNQVRAGSERGVRWDLLHDIEFGLGDARRMSRADLVEQAQHEQPHVHTCGHGKVPQVNITSELTAMGGVYFDATVRRTVNPSPSAASSGRGFKPQGTINGSANMRFYVSSVDITTGKTCFSTSDTVNNMKGTSVSCAEDEVLTDAKKTYLLDVVMPAATGVLRDALRVRPVTGPLKITSTSCGQHTVPTEVRDPGVSNTDYVIYLAAAPTDSGVVAWAGTCSTSSTDDGRPISGRVNISPKYLSPPASGGVSRTTIMTIVHELLHALGFANSGFNSASYGPPGNGSNPVVTLTRRNESRAVFTGADVVSKAKAYFACDTLEGPELEDDGGAGTSSSHWEARTHRDDVMCGVVSSQMYLSPLTLALMEGFGFYDPDYSKAETPFLLRGEGCGVHTDTCAVHHANFLITSDFCDSSAYACDQQNTYYGTCTGISLGDGCNQYSSSVRCALDDTATPSISLTDGNRKDSQSRCFPTTTDVGVAGFVAGASTRPARCFTRQCKSGGIVSFKVGNYSDWIDCPATFSFTSPQTIDLTAATAGMYQGTVTCPDPSVVCADISNDITSPPISSGDANATSNPSVGAQIQQPVSYPRGPAVAGFRLHLVCDSASLYLTGLADSVSNNRQQLSWALTLDIGRQIGLFSTSYSDSISLSAAIAKETLNNVSWKVYVRKIGTGSLAISARQKKGFTTYYTTTFPATTTVYVEGILFSSTAVSQFLMNNWNTWLRTGAFNTTLYDVSVDGANFTSYLHETRRLHQNLVAGVTSSGVLSDDTLSARRMSAMDAGVVNGAMMSQDNVTIYGDVKLFNLATVTPDEGLTDTSFTSDTQKSCGPGGCIIAVVASLMGGFFLIGAILLGLFLCCRAPANKKVKRARRRERARAPERNAAGGVYDAVVTHEKPVVSSEEPVAVESAVAAPVPENGAWADDDYYYEPTNASVHFPSHDAASSSSDPPRKGPVPFGTVYFS